MKKIFGEIKGIISSGAYPQPYLMNRFIVFFSLLASLQSYAGNLNPSASVTAPFTTGTIGDFVWQDLDRDGRQDAGEMGLMGVVVLLLDNNGNTLSTAVTDSTGRYLFSNVATDQAGRMLELQFKLPSGFRFSPKIGVISDPSMNSDADEYTGKTGLFLLQPGDAKTDMDAGLISMATGTLPLHTLDLTAQLQESKVTLKWVAENEMETRQFVIQRSTDGVNYTDIASKPMSGPINTPTQYSFVNDIQGLLSNNVIYYRIKAEDNLQRFAYSNIATVRLGKTTGIRTWPNPFVNEISITFNGLASGKTDISITDSRGTVAWSGVFDTKRGLNQLSVNGVDKLPPGIYLVTLHERSSSQLLVQKLLK